MATGNPAANPLHDLTSEQLAEIARRPLFNPTRAPRPAPEPMAQNTESPPVEGPPQPAAPEVNPSDYQLLAVASGDLGRVAVVRFAPENKVYHLREGQYLADWRVAAVSDRAVTLSRDDRSFEIAMFKPPEAATGSEANSATGQAAPDVPQDDGQDPQQ
jgi:hypothetical protein